MSKIPELIKIPKAGYLKNIYIRKEKFLASLTFRNTQREYTESNGEMCAERLEMKRAVISVWIPSCQCGRN